MSFHSFIVADTLVYHKIRLDGSANISEFTNLHIIWADFGLVIVKKPAKQKLIRKTQQICAE